MYTVLKELIKCRCVSGRESAVCDVIEKYIAPHVDSVERDAMGNLIAFKKGSGKDPKKLMFAAHTDEIGFMVNFIEKSGLIRFATIGGINFTAAAYSEVVFENGTRGVLVPEADCKAADITADKCYVDIGTKSRRETERFVKTGDTFALAGKLTKLSGTRVSGRPIDDRIGCAILIKAAEMIKKCENDVYFVFTTQEEVGIRGSKCAAFGIMPDIGVAVDVCTAGDVPGVKNLETKCGNGPAVKLKDASVICDEGVIALLKETAKENGIKVQNEILISGGTDTASIQMAGAGCPAGCISIATRYIHTGVEMIDMKDAKGAAVIFAKLAEKAL
ncbi:MAG: M42 family metallopeptidase [Ruminococcaceae bacterium]|nr:M42 family metallopeptidase [Oscillospiraceae bacterium]